MPGFLKKLKEYEESNLEESLKKLFLKFDESLLSQEAQKELKELREQIENNASTGLRKRSDEEEEEDDEDDGGEDGVSENKSKKKKKNEGDEEEDEEDEEYDENIDDDNEEENVAKLYDEATMPLEEVLKRYSSTENKVKKALKKKGLLKQTVGHPSPMIVAAGSSGSTSKLKKKQHLATPLNDLDDNNESKVERKPLDFQKQEEEDISEIKKNGGQLNELGESVNSTVQNHEQDYDEASNLVN